MFYGERWRITSHRNAVSRRFGFVSRLTDKKQEPKNHMNNIFSGKRLASVTLMAMLAILPVAAIAQTTQVRAPSNKYKVQDDIKLGNDASRQVEQKFPILNDADATNYVARVGERLVASIPPQFRQPAFDYRFKVVNARDINAFALPGGPMYVNRGMIQAAKNEGEMAGVMAHEISHVALRHATAQATKQGSAKNTLGTIGLILGGAILGGQTGAQLGGLIAQGWQTKYSREYETQADTLGARIMADAGYDPRDLANMFRTIAGERTGGGAPEFLSSHPDPGNRYAKINREAQYLNVSQNPIKITRDFERVQANLRGMQRAPTMAEIERGSKNGQGGQQNPTASGRYSTRVAYPSAQLRRYSGSNIISINIPSNWRDFPSQDNVMFAPDGAYGDQGITHGVMMGVYRGQNGDLNSDSQAYLNGVLQGNSYLQQRSQFANVNIGGRQGLAAQLAGTSPVTRRAEIVNVYTTQLRNGELFYAITVVPNNESASYNNAFRSSLNSIRFND